ncbi:MAG: ABC-type Fe(3+)-hydroxamate transport system periplasmic component [Candidatus Methanohalarchaeum thermophilum]|uniref:ABC-type Fe(3+)-hydroxamate transport system periplasmic component n=1 Tax=Methanohalarchaeum thermophilum TaxID=1903181 RepID=A0A1Q6DSW5_METT1|nr:MAG: ABC-type Fe(3+)-hydroxamate transport system periplasmic component [Candidatus Methanohalarchaeum thermophilum]
MNKKGIGFLGLASRICLLVILVTFLVGASGCMEQPGDNDVDGTVNLVDSAGRNLTIEQPVERIVTLTSDSAEAVRALDSGGKIVGVTKYMKGTDFWGNISDQPAVGSCFSPNYEKIAELDPDLVITYSKWAEDLEDKLRPFNITVVRLDFYKMDSVDTELQKLGKVLDKRERAEELLDFYETQKNKIKSNLSELPEEQRLDVYIEGHEPYSTASRESGWHQVLELVGADNIAEDLNATYPDVSSEWVLENNPDVIVKVVTGDAFGYNIDNSTRASEIYGEIVNREGLSEVDAVKDGKVILISEDVLSAMRHPVGATYLAKGLYPEKLKDLEPGEIHETYLEEFQNIRYDGNWFYRK